VVALAGQEGGKHDVSTSWMDIPELAPSVWAPALLEATAIPLGSARLRVPDRLWVPTANGHWAPVLHLSNHHVLRAPLILVLAWTIRPGTELPITVGLVTTARETNQGPNDCALFRLPVPTNAERFPITLDPSGHRPTALSREQPSTSRRSERPYLPSRRCSS